MGVKTSQISNADGAKTSQSNTARRDSSTGSGMIVGINNTARGRYKQRLRRENVA